MVTAGLIALVVALLVATVVGLAWKRRAGRLVAPPSDDTARLDADDIGAPLGERATLVHFSTAFCQPCRATRVVLAEVAATLNGVTHVEVDAESRLDLVRRLRILRTPTVLVLDRGGRIVRRASGRPSKAAVIAALGEAIPSSDVA